MFRIFQSRCHLTKYIHLFWFESPAKIPVKGHNWPNTFQLGNSYSVRETNMSQHTLILTFTKKIIHKPSHHSFQSISILCLFLFCSTFIVIYCWKFSKTRNIYRTIEYRNSQCLNFWTIAFCKKPNETKNLLLLFFIWLSFYRI